MNAVVDVVMNFFNSISAIVKSFFDFLKGLLPKSDDNNDPVVSE